MDLTSEDGKVQAGPRLYISPWPKLPQHFILPRRRRVGFLPRETTYALQCLYPQPNGLLSCFPQAQDVTLMSTPQLPGELLKRPHGGGNAYA